MYQIQFFTNIPLSVNLKIGFDLTNGENGMPALRIRDFEGKPVMLFSRVDNDFNFFCYFSWNC